MQKAVEDKIDKVRIAEAEGEKTKERVQETNS